MIKEVAWTDEAEKGLLVSAGDDLQIIKNQVLAGVSQLWLYQSETDQAFIVTRVDGVGDDRELVIVLGEGRGFKIVVPLIIAAAKKANIKTVRTHVKGMGLVRMYKPFGLELDEYVLRLKI